MQKMTVVVAKWSQDSMQKCFEVACTYMTIEEWISLRDCGAGLVHSHVPQYVHMVCIVSTNLMLIDRSNR